MDIKLFDYNLPLELIAQEPMSKRDDSRLLVVDGNKKDKILHKKFSDILDYLKKDDVLVLNETKVKKALIKGEKSTGGFANVILIKESSGIWETRVNAHRVKKGNVLVFSHGLKADVYDVKKDVFFLSFNKRKKDVEDYAEKYGELPIPFYVKKELKKEDTYQTKFAKKSGSLAAPTAGLHFTKELLEKIENKGIKIAKVCLHIDFGTFLPIREHDIIKHKMHTEEYEVEEKAADMINNRKGRLILVGTTSMRTLEAAYDDKVSGVKAGKGSTSLYIYPGYKFKNKIDAMITNFHLPKSSLLLLVSGFFGRKKILGAYKEAIKKKYRLYSFGDAMLLLK